MASELEVGKLGAGVAPAAPLHAKVAATTGSSPLEVARLEVKDDGVNLGVGMGPKQSFYMPHSAGSFEGASIAAKKETATDADESTVLVFSTCPDAGTNTERLTINSSGTATISKPQQTTTGTPFSGAALKLLPSDATNSTGVSSVALSTSALDNYGFLISGHRTGSSGTPTLRVSSHNNSDTGTEVLTISSAGLATFSNGISVTTGGIKFPATQSASADANTLDDYEEGTWVPVIGGGTCTNLVGKYTRVGNKVTILVSVANGTLASATSNQITGLPFTCGATRSTSSMVAYYHLLEVANPIALLDGGSTTIYMISNQAGSTWAHNDFTNCTGAYLHFSLTYFV